MTMVSPHGLQIVESRSSRRANRRVRVSARVAHWDAIRGAGAMNLALLSLLAVAAALIGALFPTVIL